MERVDLEFIHKTFYENMNVMERFRISLIQMLDCLHLCYEEEKKLLFVHFYAEPDRTEYIYNEQILEDIELLSQMKDILEEQMYKNKQWYQGVENAVRNGESEYSGFKKSTRTFRMSPDALGEIIGQSASLSNQLNDISRYIDVEIEWLVNNRKFKRYSELRKVKDECCRAVDNLMHLNDGTKMMFTSMAEIYQSANFSEVTSTKAVQPLRIDSVQFSALSPKEVILGEYFPVNILMYEDEYRSVVEEIRKELGDNTQECRKGYQNVQENAKVKVRLSSPNVEIEDNEDEGIWCGKYLNFEFVVMIPEDYEKKQAVLQASVYIDNVIATKLKLIVNCGDTKTQAITVTRKDIQSAFVSYASQDRNRVASIVQGMQKIRPDMDVFFDVKCLHSGQRWEEVLKKEIENRDVLFLCWSKAASKSEWVEMEWRYALEKKGEEYIDPIPIELPEECPPPPEELSRLHFNDMILFIIR